MSRVLITGANGHVGCHVVRACIEAGHAPVAFVRAQSDRRGLEGIAVEMREGNLLDAGSLRAAMAGIETVIHVGAVHRNFSRNPDDIIRPAIEGTRNVLAAAQDAGVRRVVHCSTGATVGFSADLAQPIDERSALATARSAYIRGKIGAEKLALDAARSGQDVVILNPSGIFGPLDYRLTPATRALVSLLQGDPAFFGVCVTDVRDVARAHVLAADVGKSGERYLVTGDNLSPTALAALLGELAGVRPPTFRPPGFLLRFLIGRQERSAAKTGIDAPATVDSLADLGDNHICYDSSKSKRELGMTYRPARQVLTDALRWLLHVQALRPKTAAKVRGALGALAAPDPAWTRTSGLAA